MFHYLQKLFFINIPIHYNPHHQHVINICTFINAYYYYTKKAAANQFLQRPCLLYLIPVTTFEACGPFSP